jgi:proline iminopeptidase
VWLRRVRDAGRPFRADIVMTHTGCAVAHAPGEFIDIGDTRLWVEREGSGEVLVLLAGGPANSHVNFHPTFSRLADRCEIVYYDYRGRGRSDAAPHGSITFDGDVADLDALRRALGVERIHLYGFSYGGLVAQAYALAHPQHVGRLVLANTLYSAAMWKANHDNINAELERQFPDEWDEILALRARGVLSSSSEMQRLFAVHGPLTRWYDASRAASLPTEPGSPNRALYYAFVGDDIEFDIGGEVAKLPDFRPRLAELAMPVLILAGRYDRALYPRLQREFRTYCPQARFVMLEKSGTFGHVEEPDTVLALLREFLA